MEIWKDIPNYEGRYQVSDLGGVRSLDRLDSLDRKIQGKVMSNRMGGNYFKVSLCKDGKIKDEYVHVLVAESFLNHKKQRGIVVDHINNDGFDNRLENLQIITQRENINKDCKGSSKYDGVYKGHSDKWYSHLRVSGKDFHLGTFNTESRANIAYQFAIMQLNNLEKILS